MVILAGGEITGRVGKQVKGVMWKGGDAMGRWMNMPKTFPS
jgi:hypothetical protein